MIFEYGKRVFSGTREQVLKKLTMLLEHNNLEWDGKVWRLCEEKTNGWVTTAPDLVKQYLIKKALAKVPTDITFHGLSFDSLKDLKDFLRDSTLLYGGGARFHLEGYTFDSTNYPADIEDIREALIKEIILDIK